MTAILHPRKLIELNDVSTPPDPAVGDVPTYDGTSFIFAPSGGSAAAFRGGVSNLGNTLGQTGVTGTRLVLAGIGNLTLSQLTDASGGTITISGGTAGAGFSLGASGGNTAGQTGATGTRVVLAGGNGITLSQATDANGGSITISGQTFSQSVQTQDRFDLTLDGNTAGALQLVSSGTLTLAGGNNVTLSQNGNAITISGAATHAEQTGISSIVASNATYTSGSVQFTGSGIITVRSSANQRVVIDASQSAQTQNLHNVTLSGNTAGAMAQISSGTMTLAGGANITLSQNGNAVTISGAAGGAETQTAISGIAASNTTYTSGTVTITGVGGGVTVSSNTGQRIDISVAAPVAQTNQAGSVYAVGNTTSSSSGTYDARTLSLRGDGIISIAATNSGFRISATQSVQTQNLIAMTLSGNTSGAQALISSGTMTLAGGNNITVSQNGNAVTISGPNVGGAQTGISGIAASNTTYTSGSVTITGVGGGITVSSNTGQRIDLSVAAQSAESQSIGMSNIGNTSGTTGIASGAQVRMLFAGGNNITLSQSLNGASGTLTISGPNTVAQTNQAGSIYAIGNTTSSSSGTYDARTLSISGAGIISIAATNSGWKISATESVQTQNLHNVTLSGNTSGAMAQISSGTMTLAGGNNITLSQAGNAITISGANVGGAQTGISGIANSQTTYTSGTVSMSELGAITIRSTTGNQFQFSVNAQSVQPETQTFVGGLANSQTTYTSGTISLSELGAITIRSTTGNQFQLSVNSQTVQTQSLFSAGVSTGGNTAGDTGITGTRMVFVGSNNITLSQATAAAGGTITISGPTTLAQTNQSGGVYAVGNTYSSSSGTYDARSISIRGDGIISVAATNSGFRISASQSVQAETQTFIGGLAASNTTYTSGTITITGVGGGVTVSSNTGQRIDISVAAPVAQTNQTLGMYAVQNTTGQSSSTTMDARTISVAGDGIVSAGYSAGSLRISATQSVQTQNLHNVTLSGNTAGAMAHISSGTMTLAGGNNITLSQAGNAVTISGGAGGAFSAGASNLGNTDGATGVSGSQMVLVGSAVISLSQTTGANGNTVSILGPAVSAISAVAPLSTTTNGSTISILGPAQFSGGFSTNGNTAGNTGFVTGRLALVGSNNITLSGSTDAGSQTISIIGGAGGAGFSAGVSNIGNSAGDTGVTGTRMVLAGGNNVTLSQSTNANGNTITVSAFNQSVQSLGMYAVQNTTAQSSSTTMDARTLSVAGDGAVSVGYSAGSLRISAPTQTVQTQNLHNVTLSGNTAGAMAHISSGTMTLAGGNGITLSQAGNAVTISGGAGGAAFSGGASNLGNTAGATGISGTQMVLVGSGVMSLSQTTGANGNTVSILAPAQSALSAVAPLSLSTNGSTISIIGPAQLSVGFSTAGNTAGDTGFVTGRLALVGSNGITLSGSTNAGSQTITISGATQTNQAGSVYAVGNTTSSSSGTYDARTLSIRGDGIISIAATNSGFRISATQSVQTQNVHNVTLSGNTAGAMAHISSGTMTLAGGNNITLSQAGNAVTISGGAGGGFSAGVSTGGNTQGNTGVTGTRLVFVGTNNITLSQNTDANGGTISISGQSPAGGAFSGGVSTLGNTAGATGISGTQMVLVGSGVMSLSQTTGANGNTVSILAPASSVLSAVAPLSTSTNGSTISVLGPATSSLIGTSGISISTNGSTISIMQTTGSAYLTSLAPYDESPMVTGAQGQATLHLSPVRIPEGLQFDRIGLGVQMSNATNSSNSITISQWVGFYTKNASTLSLYASTSITTNFTGSGTVGSYSLYGGPKWHTIPWTTTIPEGDYYVGINMRTTTGGGGGHIVSQLLVSKFTNSAWSGLVGVGTNATDQRLLGLGVYTVSTAGMPASIGFTQINGSGSQVLRLPIWHVRSGTV